MKAVVHIMLKGLTHRLLTLYLLAKEMKLQYFSIVIENKNVLKYLLCFCCLFSKKMYVSTYSSSRQSWLVLFIILIEFLLMLHA
jgi:hypothetical protein